MSEPIMAHLRAALAELEDFRLPMPIEALGPQLRLVEDLGLDSVALLDLVLGLERRLGRAIDESELVELGTLGAIAARLGEG